MDSGSVPVSGTDRDAAIERLRAANAEGRMDLAELMLRTESIRSATTSDEVARLTSDLAVPAGRPSGVPAVRSGRSVSVSGFTLFGSKKIAVQASAASELAPVVRVRAFTVFGSVKVWSA
jgi:Domain of unknown function (DUF1707)